MIGVYLVFTAISFIICGIFWVGFAKDYKSLGNKGDQRQAKVFFWLFVLSPVWFLTIPILALYFIGEAFTSSYRTTFEKENQ